MSTFDKPISARVAAAEARRRNPKIEEAEKRLGAKLVLARNLLRHRVQRGLTQAEFAELVGVSQPRIAEIEGARANPQFETLERMANALGVPLERLVSEKLAQRERKTSVHRSVQVSARTDGEGWSPGEVDAVVRATSKFAASGGGGTQESVKLSMRSDQADA
jgi:transcriptional regulator with XRE-family HTH domain